MKLWISIDCAEPAESLMLAIAPNLDQASFL